jgi:hypothetical protein
VATPQAELIRIDPTYYVLQCGSATLLNIFINPRLYTRGPDPRILTWRSNIALRVYPDGPLKWVSSSMPIIELLRYVWRLEVDTRKFVAACEEAGWDMSEV